MTPTSGAVLVLAILPLLCLAGTFTLSIWLGRYAGTLARCGDTVLRRRACAGHARWRACAAHVDI